jgi:hypothetical protein
MREALRAAFVVFGPAGEVQLPQHPNISRFHLFRLTSLDIRSGAFDY